MIPIDKIIPANLYSQDDASFLLGKAFTEEAAREAICEACRSGQLASRSWRRRYWFTGAGFVSWVRQWYGPEIRAKDDHDDGMVDRLAPDPRLGDNEPRRLGARSPENGEGVGT